ncbi:MAG TPA: hypothetical protein VIL18_05525 [Longimicrobiales bacterium]
MQEPGSGPPRFQWTGRGSRPLARRGGALPLRRAPAAPVVQGTRRERGQRLGAYETRYDIRRGYATDRTIIRP